MIFPLRLWFSSRIFVRAADWLLHWLLLPQLKYSRVFLCVVHQYLAVFWCCCCLCCHSRSPAMILVNFHLLRCAYVDGVSIVSSDALFHASSNGNSICPSIQGKVLFPNMVHINYFHSLFCHCQQLNTACVLTQFDKRIFLFAMLHVCKIHFPTPQLRADITLFIAAYELAFAGDHFTIDTPTQCNLNRNSNAIKFDNQAIGIHLPCA